MAEPITTPIFPSLTPINQMMNKRGFSLIEMLIVVAILGLVGLVVLPSMSTSFRRSSETAARDIGTLIKDTVNSAQITGKIHRVVYDLKNQQYWVEFTGESTLLQSEESKQYDKDHQSSFFKKDDEDEDKKKGGFTQAKNLTSKKRTLPIGVSFKDVYTEQNEKPITEGLAYTHIFPHGVSEQSLVHLSDTSKNEFSLIVSNLLGRSTVEGHYVDLKEAFNK